MAKLSPMMEQYFEIKKQYPDTLLFFRLGDFYEMFFDDAKIASRELELVLTGRDCGQEERAPMCGVPFHSADSYIAKLVARGYKVAICEQLEDPALAKGIVKRDVIRIVTPGTVIESSMLDEGRHNYLGSVFVIGTFAGCAFVDVSTGDVQLDSFTEGALGERIVDRLTCCAPTEVLLNTAASEVPGVLMTVRDRIGARYTVVTDGAYSEPALADAVQAHLPGDDKHRDEFRKNKALLFAFGAALQYLESVQKNSLDNISDADFYEENGTLTLNPS
ncbi:MAG: DNA mismatch repair protein MutS, partial [Clostridia bacterium]|nr:DNA mismatch repair protein MutS [Clostridia bacterium]